MDKIQKKYSGTGQVPEVSTAKMKTGAMNTSGGGAGPRWQQPADTESSSAVSSETQSPTGRE